MRDSLPMRVSHRLGDDRDVPQRVAIRIGRRRLGVVEVLEGLAEGDLLAATPDGSEVAIKRIAVDPATDLALLKIEPGKTENMRQCKYCGVHVPESAILVVNDEPYCCQDHAELDQQ